MPNNFYSFADSGLLEELRLSHKYMAKKEREQVFEKGLTEGSQETIKLMAGRCIATGLSLNKTARITGLTLQELKEIKGRIENILKK